jgi:hypothetical protein
MALDAKHLRSVTAAGSTATIIGAGAAFALTPLVGALAAVAAIATLVVAMQGAVLTLLLVRPMADLASHGVRVPGSTATLDASAAIALLFIFAALYLVLVHRVAFARVPLVAPFAAVLIVAAASFVASSDKVVTAISLLRLSSQLGVFIVVYFVVTRWRDVNRTVAVICLSALGPVMWGFFEIATGHALYLRESLANGITDPRLDSPFGGGLTLGTFLVLPTVLAVVLFGEARTNLGKLLWGVLLLMLLTSMYFTLARSAWVGLVLALGLLGLVRYRQIFMAGPLAVIIVIALVPGILLRVSPLLTNPQETTAVGRVARAEGALAVFHSHPILGAGLGIGDKLAGVEAAGRASPAHNDYLRVLADLGVLGFMAYLWLTAATGIVAVKTLGVLKTPKARALATAFLGVWVAFLVIRLTGNVFTHQVFQYNFWALAGVVLALPRIEAMKEEEPWRPE